MRRLALALLVALLLAAAGGFAITEQARRAIRRVRPALPSAAVLLDDAPAADALPTGLRVLHTSEQPMPRSAVLDPDLDPDPQAPYVMTHPAFALSWPDGRMLLVDAGMEPASAEAFGRPIEWLSGGQPIRPLGGLAGQLGPDAARVRGIVFTHLHTDHTDGLPGLCDAVDHPIPVFQGAEQHDLGNYTTRAGREHVAEAACARPVRLAEPGPRAIPGFPGVRIVTAAGHTPGSQILVAHLATPRGVVVRVFTGDVVNHRDAIRHDIPKPPAYSRWVVPEDTERLAALRRLLARLAVRPDVALVVSHDAVDVRGLPAR